MSQAPFQIGPARSADDLEATVALFEVHVSSLGVDLFYQGFAAELAAMPGKYAPRGASFCLRAAPTESRWAAWR